VDKNGEGGKQYVEMNVEDVDVYPTVLKGFAEGEELPDVCEWPRNVKWGIILPNYRDMRIISPGVDGCKNGVYSMNDDVELCVFEKNVSVLCFGRELNDYIVFCKEWWKKALGDSGGLQSSLANFKENVDNFWGSMETQYSFDGEKDELLKFVNEIERVCVKWSNVLQYSKDFRMSLDILRYVSGVKDCDGECDVLSCDCKLCEIESSLRCLCEEVDDLKKFVDGMDFEGMEAGKKRCSKVIDDVFKVIFGGFGCFGNYCVKCFDVCERVFHFPQ